MKRKMKFTAVIAVIALLMMTAAGCSDSSNNGSSADSGSTGEAYQVGIVQQLEHPALDEATEGFQQALIDKLGEDGVEFDLQNAQNEQANCSTISQGFVSGNMDLIMANGTNALQAASAATADIPIVATSITDYATALNIEDWTGSTGTSDLAPLQQQAEMIRELVPDVQKVGLLYCSAEANSAYQIAEIEKYLDDMGIAYEEYAAADSNEIQAVTTSAVSECDALYIPTDKTMAGSTETVNNIAQPAGVPVIAGEEGICGGCGVATLTISYYDIGYAAGEMAYEILVNDADPGTMEIQTAENVTKKYNPTLCEALNITVPEGYEAISTDSEA